MLSPAEIAETIVESQRGFATAGYGLWLVFERDGTEAARAVVEHALGPLGLPEVLAEVDEGNAASVAVVTRLGMTAFGVAPGVLGPMTRYRRTA
jgi:ribosomal-protein-alanine N-acetyltransferase